VNLFLAIYEEHRQRTGHQCEKRDDSRVWACTVCNVLIAEKRAMDKAEQATYSETADSTLSLKDSKETP
jgi:Zn-finger protein